MKFKIKSFLFPLRYIDLFQQNVSLKLKSKYRVSLLLGRILSLGIIFFIVYNAINSDMINKTNPIVLQQELKTQLRPHLELNHANFMLAFAVSDDESYYPADPTIYNFGLNLVSYKNRNYIYDSMDFEPCNQTPLTNSGLVEDFKSPHLNCMKVSNFTLKGYWDEKEMIFLSIYLRRCVNNSETNNICKSNEEIDHFFKKKYVDIFLYQQNFDINNYQNPIMTNVKHFFTALELGKRKEVIGFLKKTKILTDRQTIYSSYDELDTYIFEEGSLDLQNSDKDLLSFDLYSSDYMLVYSRRYEKLFNLLASLGGILHPLLLIGTILIKFVNDWKINELIMNRIYVLDQALIKKNNKRIFRTSDNENSKVCLKFSLWEKIKYILKRESDFSSKEAIYHKYLKKSNEKLDLIQVLKKLEEIQRMKLVFFDKKQLKIFERFSKNIIFDEKDDAKKSMFKFTFDGKKEGGDYFRVLESIEEIKHNKGASRIDRNLIKIVDGGQEIKGKLAFI